MENESIVKAEKGEERQQNNSFYEGIPRVSRLQKHTSFPFFPFAETRR